MINQLRKNQFDIRKFSEKTIFASESTLKDYTGDSQDPIPLLYQTGYLTISDYEAKRKRYTLSFPNEEVRYGFLELCAKKIISHKEREIDGHIC